MRRLLFVLAATGFALDATAAECTDTLHLSGLRQFGLSFKNVRSNAWDSSVVDIRQAGKATSLSMKPAADTASVAFPVEFRSNCGSDSVSDVSFVELSNIPYTVRGTTYWRDTSRAYTASEKVLSYPDGVSYDGKNLKGFWNVGDFQVGKLEGGEPAVYHIQCVAFRHKNGGYSYSHFSPMFRAERSMAFAAVDQMLSSFAGALDSVGKGLDSVRVSVRLTETTFSYDPTTWAFTTGTHARVARAQSFSAYRTSEGYSFVLPSPVALSVFAPDGRVVRTLPASTSAVWDGRDQSGRKVTRGVYLVRAMGLGVLSIAAP